MMHLVEKIRRAKAKVQQVNEYFRPLPGSDVAEEAWRTVFKSGARIPPRDWWRRAAQLGWDHIAWDMVSEAFDLAARKAGDLSPEARAGMMLFDALFSRRWARISLENLRKMQAFCDEAATKMRSAAGILHVVVDEMDEAMRRLEDAGEM